MKCLFKLYRVCNIINVLCQDQHQQSCDKAKEFGSEKFVKLYCAMCIKSLYAKRFKLIKYSVVNTL
jgi:hypothetical protein